MYNPISTYRVQFNKDFTFNDFEKNLEYFFLLNPSTIYASPIFEATPGSMHGYDGTNPDSIDPEIGTFARFNELNARLKAGNIGWIQDIVPNHMAFHMNNRWLMDVLEKGQASEFATFFDIDFSHPAFNGKLMVPFLGKHAEEAVKNNEITIEWVEGKLYFSYFDFRFPLNTQSYILLARKFPSVMPSSVSELMGRNSPDDYDPSGTIEHSEPSDDSMKRLCDTVNRDNQLIIELLNKQYYKLCFWNEAGEDINYRRFFTVSSLICLRMENEQVFEAYHRYIERQVKAGRFNGLRIDHIDGLQRPVNYMEKLRILSGEDTYIVVEKILEKDEVLPGGIPIQGSSGYDFLGIVNNVFTRNENYAMLKKLYRKITGIRSGAEDLIYEKKKFILLKRMHGELKNLSRMFDESGFTVYDGDVSSESMKDAIAEFLVRFPVYRIYSDHFPLQDHDIKVVEEVLRVSREKNPALAPSFKVLATVFLSNDNFTPEEKEKALKFFLRCMQFTGPLMAKGVEDTTMYYYNSFIGHNEVGDDPGAEGMSIEDFHMKMSTRQERWPMTMNATSTHDTKRGEDVRARLNVLSEMPEEWSRMVRDWMNANAEFRTQINNSFSPDENEEYFIYQTLIGVFPFEGLDDDTFMPRLEEYLVKSMREAKANTNWNEPDEEHENAVIEFTRKILKPDTDFMFSFDPFRKRVSDFGIINSLSQLMLKACCPGVPDFYQGTELWDLSMVDPDNRRPVDYEKRQRWLENILDLRQRHPDRLFLELYLGRNDGRIKLWMTHMLMEQRRLDPGLFLHGRYVPLEVKGRFKDHMLAFARVHENRWCIVAIPLFLTLIPENEMREEPGKVSWEDTTIILPPSAPDDWDISTGRKFLKSGNSILLSEIMNIPFPLLLSGKKEPPVRFAGVLAHISSLPGKYGTGGLGKEAFEFARLLSATGQTYWQILPFNPTGKGFAWSPYSSVSAFAGNPLFINPGILLERGLVSGKTINSANFSELDRSDFKKAEEFRNVILDEAFDNFFCHERPYQLKLFNDFCINESYWLDDYSLFMTIREELDQTPWHTWPEKIKKKDSGVIHGLHVKYASEIKKKKFIQFVFQSQWKAFKDYCNSKGLRIIGDISFYINYDSADVWSHPQYFKLDRGRNPVYVSGVPPDYFSKTGQLWNMPVYNWNKLKNDKYDWWLKRIKRNLDLCNVVRFDHFRGFAEYWEVPYGESTAENGKWTKGPGNDFFDKVSSEFPGMPFIAEDLGSIDEKVLKLRDDYSLPGMAVLQFAFGDNTPRSSYIPHNHNRNSIVYTGTHDNNTIRGWFRNELTEKSRRESEEYVGHKIPEDKCHEDFIRMAYASVAGTAIIPVQDILGLDESARLNKPSTIENNWEWKLTEQDLKDFPSEKMLKLAVLFGRI